MAVLTAMTTFKTDALICEQNNTKFYIGVISNKILQNICYVARRDEDPKAGFQRLLNETRAKDITKYLDDFKGTIPSALILSAQENAKFKFDESTKELKFFLAKSSFLVLDGQHRLYGLILSKNEYKIPVIIYNGLKPKDEVGLFIDINTTQKGVPSTLLLDIKHLAGTETNKQELQRLLFDKINEKSVMQGLMSPSKSQVGKITRVSFNTATDTIFAGGFFEGKDMEVIYNGVKNFLEAAERTFEKSKASKAKLTNSTFFRAIFSIFNDTIDKSLTLYSNLKVSSIEKVLEPISKINFDIYTGTSNATLQKLISDMKKELNEYDKRYSVMNKQDIF